MESVLLPLPDKLGDDYNSSRCDLALIIRTKINGSEISYVFITLKVTINDKEHHSS